MSLNHSPNIEWIHPDPKKRFTANPITGCKKGCGYCYGRDIHNRFKRPGRFDEPRFHPERLAVIRRKLERRKDNVGVFLCSVSDPFGSGVERDGIHQIQDLIDACPQHTFFMLTKRPDQMKFLMPRFLAWWRPNVWIGVTVEADSKLDRIDDLLRWWPCQKFISFEPLLDQVNLTWWTPKAEPWRELKMRFDWAIIGGLSGSYNPISGHNRTWLECAQARWGKQIITDCQQAGIPVFVKTKPIKIPGLPVIQQWPEIINKNAGVENG